MAMKTYSGSCHCGAVRYQADIDFAAGSNRCNCSLCAKARSWFVLVQPEHFRLLKGEDAQREYRWTPPNRPGPNLHYRFCSTCGIRTVGRGEPHPNGGAFYFVAVASLDDVDPQDLAAGKVRYLDGRHDRYDRAPPNTELL